LCIEVQQAHALPPFPDAWQLVGKSLSELQKAYERTLWGVQFVPQGPLRILQAGSMAGHEPALMRCLDFSRSILVIDLLLDCARNSKEIGFEASVASIFALPMYSETFDCVYNNNVIEHLYGRVDAAFIEIHRVLKPGGIFSFVMPIETNPSNPDLAFQTSNLGRTRNWWLADPTHPWKTDLYDIHYRLKTAGFQNIRFAFRNEDIENYRQLKESRNRRRTFFSRVLEKLYLAFEESLFFQELESDARKLFHFYHFKSFRRKIPDWLGLPNRHIETLQVLVFAEKASE
jgi:SAM-dependent methyltransferase